MSRALTTNQPSPTGRTPVSPRSSRASSAIVVHQLDVVAVGVEDEGAVVALVVDEPLARRAVVAIGGVDGDAVELLHGSIVARAEGQMKVLGRRPVDEGERRVLADEMREAVALVVERVA